MSDPAPRPRILVVEDEAIVARDIQLAGAMNGVDAATQIRNRFAIPVVFLTAFAEDSTLERAKLAEPFGYVLKPYAERELRIVRERRLSDDAATLEALGEALGISKERVRQIENRALEKLKAALLRQQVDENAFV